MAGVILLFRTIKQNKTISYIHIRSVGTSKVFIYCAKLNVYLKVLCVGLLLALKMLFEGVVLALKVLCVYVFFTQKV